MGRDGGDEPGQEKMAARVGQGQDGPSETVRDAGDRGRMSHNPEVVGSCPATRKVQVRCLARKRPDLIPIEDSQIAGVFRRKAPDRDEHWWDDVRTVALDTQLTASGTTLWGHLARLRGEAGADHLPVLRVLDIIGWMHARRGPGA